MLKLASFGLLGFLVVLMLPANVDEQTPGFLYGAATLVAHDAYGNEIFSQTIHNQLFDEGEDFLNNQAFTDIGGAVIADTTQIGAICLSADSTPSTLETDTNTIFNTDHDAEDNVLATVITNCITAPTATNPVTALAQVVTIGPLTFTAGAADLVANNWFAGDTVFSIGICDASATDTDVRGCTSTLFAVVNTSDVTLADTETVDVTYTFDISSGGS